MTTHKGFALVTVAIIVAGVLLIGGGVYVLMHPKGVSAPADEYEQQADAQIEETYLSEASITWKITSAGVVNDIPRTAVAVVVGEREHIVGTFEGSCTQIGASGGVDGKGLLAGELSAVQCWFAGGGDEIGVFAHEDGGYQILVGRLEKSIEGSAGFRGDFTLNVDVP